VEQDAGAPGRRRSPRRLAHARLIVNPHHRHQRRPSLQGRVQRVEIELSVRCNRKPLLTAQLLSRAQAASTALFDLPRRDQHAAVMGARRPPDHREIVGFVPGRKKTPALVRRPAWPRFLPAACSNPPSRPAERCALEGFSKVVPSKWQHGLQTSAWTGVVAA
jgi:hypothetical protein